MILCPPTPTNRRRHDLQIGMAAKGYLEYSNLAHRELSRMQSCYRTMSRRHKWIGYDLGYPSKLNMLAETIDVNAIIAEKISEMATGDYVPGLKDYMSSQGHQQLERIRDVLKQIIREWSVEGATERSSTFTPIMDVLTKVAPHRREETTVLVPGSGLGRLAWEIASMGVKSLDRSYLYPSHTFTR